MLSLSDHQVGAAEQRQRYGKAEALSGFQIDNQLDLGSLLNWKIGWLFTLENSARINTGQAVTVQNVRSVAHKTASERKLAVRIYGWHCMAGRQRDEPITLA